jgi:hypothetical protein
MHHPSSSLLPGLAPKFGVVPASNRKLHIPDAVALPDFQSKYFFFRCSAGLEPGRRLYAVRVRVLRGTTHAALCRCAGVVTLASWRRGAAALWRRVLHNLEVGYVSFIINACVGA